MNWFLAVVFIFWASCCLGDVVIELPLPDGAVPLAMVEIPSGTAVIGSVSPEAGSLDLERHSEWVEGFWIEKYEVTQAQYRAVTGRKNPADLLSVEYQALNSVNCPVFLIHWTSAIEFILC